MKIIDTHSHIYHPDFDEDIDRVIDRAKKTGVTHILLPNVDLPSVPRVHNLADTYPNYCLPMMGMHPTSITANWQSELMAIKEYFAHRQYIAVGEIGVDLYWDKSLRDEQMMAFKEQLRWSIEYDLPVAIHSRDAVMECVECIKELGAKELRGVFHSFGGNDAELEEVLTLDNFLIGVNGVVTFKNATLANTIAKADLSRLIVETDAPYLTPAPFRGKRNESSYTIYIVEKLAEMYRKTATEIGEITTANAKALFRL